MAEALEDINYRESAAIEFIRDELRDKLYLTRRQNRFASLSRHRLTLKESFDEDDVLNEEYVTSAAKMLRKKMLNPQEYGKLQNALIQSENHINAFFKVENAVQGLIRDLSSKFASSKLSAANCLCNLALGNSKSCFTTCKFAAPYLLVELESTCQPLMEACAWTIGNLVCNSEKAFSILHAQGCLTTLIKLAHKSSDSVLPALNYALLRYIHVAADQIGKACLVELGCTLASRFPTVSDEETMWLIAILSSYQECHESLLMCMDHICSYLHTEAIKEVENIIKTLKNNRCNLKISAALRTVCNTVCESSGQVASRLLTQNGDLLMRKLLNHKYVHIRQETLWLLGNIYNHCTHSVQQALEHINILPSYFNLAIKTLQEIT